MEIQFTDEEVTRCRTFAKEVAWKHGHFADKRNHSKRNAYQKEQDIILGKLAEIAVHRALTDFYPQTPIEDIDFNIYPHGEFDKGDIIFDNQVLSIKSSKPYSSCLMIETAKFTIVNDVPIEIDKTTPPDAIVFVHVDIEGSKAIIRGATTLPKFWKDKTYLPRGMFLNYHNAKRALINKEHPNTLPKDKGTPLLADNYGLHLQQLQPLNAIVFPKQPQPTN